jgi:beta-lactamase class A
VNGINQPGSGIGEPAALAAIAAVASRCTGAIGLAARHLESGETLAWRDGEQFQTASMIKVAIHVAVMRRVRSGAFRLDDRVELKATDPVGGSGVLAVLRPGLRCTVQDLCTLMIVVSDNTATNMLIDLCGGVAVVNDDLAALGLDGVRLNRRLRHTLAADEDNDKDGPGVPLATASPAAFCELMSRLHAGTVVDAEASAQIINVLRHQQHQSLFPRAYLEIPEPGDPPDARGPAVASKTGSIDGCRTEAGLLYLPDGGGTVAYAAAADGLADRTMTALAEGDEVLGRLGAIVLARWWPGPGPVPVRDGWLPSAGQDTPATGRPPSPADEASGPGPA